MLILFYEIIQLLLFFNSVRLLIMKTQRHIFLNLSLYASVARIDLRRMG